MLLKIFETFDDLHTLTIVDSTDNSISVPHETVTKVVSVNVVKDGCYLQIRYANFGKNNSTNPGFRVLSSVNSSGPGRRHAVVVPAIQNYPMYIQHIFVGTLNAGTIAETYVYQNSGSAITCWPAMQLIKLN